jgi:hypothetical protein
MKPDRCTAAPRDVRRRGAWHRDEHACAGEDAFARLVIDES